MPNQDETKNKNVIRGVDPNGPKGNVGRFISPKTHEVVFVYPKRGESHDDAFKRVAARHNLQT